MPELDDYDDNDPALLAAAVGEVRRIRSPEAPSVPRPSPRAGQFRRDEAEALDDSRNRPFRGPAGADPSHYRRADVAERILRRLRRGLFAVEDEIDLHGLGARAAEDLLRRFLRDAQEHGHRCLRIIHGKGLHSKQDEPVLRPLIEHLLRQRADTLAFCSAPSAQGGTGALLVLTARRRATQGGA